ncbi:MULTISPECIES: P-loop NTPase fold protein [unclassified Psychrobacter]|uniref:YobI family P-loop NTPase n=1 Tax=unclassified Psychrobacter TaxID=196806 RepID=UPI00040924A6|nr:MULTISPECIES: P-loop NTPase fold protein [unclassified Psychrobacter]
MEKIILNHRVKLEKISNSKVENEHQIHSLSPLNNLDEGEGKESYERYENRLISALNEESVFNIAVTGIYGSGKSSVLNTFKKKYKENSQWEFLDISLSSFQVNKDTLSDNKDLNTIDENDNNIKIKEELTPEQIQLIERSILQQFFYAVPQNKIPLSRFKRITGNALTNRITALSVIILVISGLIVFDKVGYIEAIYSLPTWLPELAFWFFLVCSILLLYKLLNISFELSEIKLSFHNSEFNIKNEKDKSILNDHLDEILYFFEATGKNVVIIEDLDRFNNNEIFVRLRELNSMINKYCEDRVVFIYAIKDDMFTDNERSKFFEYIIPIIPIINPTNAYDLIQKNYKEVVKDIDKRFLRNTCLYFDDMRLVKNILNEYQDYDNHLKYLQLDKNQVFAIIVYKNYYPNDFSKLNSNRGLIYDIFNNVKNSLIDKKIAGITEKIHELERRKLELSNEMLLSIDELNAVYSYYLNSLIRKKHDVVKYIKVDGEPVDIDKYDEDLFLKLESLKNKKIEFSAENSSHYWFDSSGVSFSDVEDSINSQLIYSERLAIIRAKTNEEKKQISNNLSRLKDKLYTIKNKTIKRLLQDIDIKQLLQDEEIPDIPEQLMFFIINGYINENYPDYISLFFESSISRSDKNYAMVVNGRQMPKFELELTHQGELLLSYLSEDEMSTSSVLNISMLGYLLETTSFIKHKQNFIQKICDKSDISIEFLAILFNKDVSYLSLLIPILIKQDDTVFDEILDDIEDEQTTNNYSKIIRYGIDILDTSSYLSEKINIFLSQRNDYIDFVMNSLSKNEGKFKQLSLSIQPKFSRLDATNLDLFNWLGEQGFFSVELDVIKAALMGNLSLSLDELDNRLKNAPLTTICDSEINYLVEDIWSENLSEYIRVILLDADDNTSYHEDEDIYIKALNGLDSRNSITEKFIDLNSTKIKDIGAVKNYRIQQYLIGSLKVQYSWSNVFKYFSESYEDQDDQGAYREIDGSLVKFLENGQSYLQMINYTESDILGIEDWEDTKAEFDKNIFLCNELSDEAYKNLIRITDGDWNNASLEYLNQEKILSLIGLGKLSLTPDNWNQVKEHTSNKVIEAFLVKYHKLIIEDLGYIKLRVEDVEVLLGSNSVSNKDKKTLAETEAIDLIEDSTTVREQVIEIYKSDKMPSSIYEQLIKYADSSELKNLLLKQINYLNKQAIVEVLSLLDDPYRRLAKGEEVEFANTEENRNLLGALNNAQIVVKVPKAKRPKGNLMGQKVLTTRLQLHVLGN